MADTEKPEDENKKKRSKVPLFAGLAAALLLGAGGFFATYTGMVSLPEKKTADASTKAAESVVFVSMQPLVISLGREARARHLRFTGELEVVKGREGEVTKLMPRVLDVLNGYLRAVDLRDVEEPSALIRLRAQMLRRIQIVTGPEPVRDLLVTEFVLN